MVGTEDNIPLLDRLGAVLGRLDERTNQMQKTTEKIASDVVAIRDTQTEHSNLLTNHDGRLLTLEEREKKDARKVAVIGGASGIGGMGLIGILWNVVEAIMKGLPR